MTGKKKKKKVPAIKTTPWEVTANRYVGFVDIMGFKDLLVRRGHDYMYRLMQQVSSSVASVQAVFAHDDNDDDGIDVNVTMMLYSDSIMVFSRDDSPESLENFLVSISELSYNLFIDEIPHKGAIAHGTMTLDYAKSIFIGQPLVDAYLLQEELKFYGIVVHGTAEQKKDIHGSDSVLEYKCPFKTGVAYHLTIAPGIVFSYEFDLKTVDLLENAVGKLREKTSGPLRQYIDSTLNYLSEARAEGIEILKEEEELEKEDTNNSDSANPK